MEAYPKVTEEIPPYLFDCLFRKRDHWEDQDVGGWAILKWILERYDGMDWIDLAQDRDK
jgi:hypothetical protein